MRSRVFQFIGILISAGVFVGCASHPAEPETPAPKAASETASPRIDIDGIKRELGLDTSPTDLGYHEASFDSCAIGYGYSHSHDCRRLTMAVVHFRLLCRDTDGTVAQGLTASELRPLANRPVHWNLETHEGHDSTDSQGDGEVVVTSKKSPKTARLRLAVGNDFLYVRAGELTRIAVPPSWCQGD